MLETVKISTKMFTEKMLNTNMCISRFILENGDVELLAEKRVFLHDSQRFVKQVDEIEIAFQRLYFVWNFE